jgi:hypothetical protein
MVMIAVALAEISVAAGLMQKRIPRGLGREWDVL